MVLLPQMAPLNVARTELVRLAGKGFRSRVASRGFRTSVRMPAAQVYNMPAMSPTMTEGNISRWNLKEGDTFEAGTVLLEIETDKASMDVEAQDDGILAKIMQPDGAKSIPVGKAIAVLADPGDDISTLEIPKEEAAAPQETKSATKEAPKEGSDKTALTHQFSGEKAEKAEKGAESIPAKPQKQTYPLYPSVIQLLHENGLDSSEADKIPATGPNGRLLKGDVLAYLGQVEKSYSAEQSKRIAKLGHLDLSNIKIVTPPPSKPTTVEEEPTPEEELDTEVAVTISFQAVREVQQRIQKTLQIDIPLETFVTRAIDISNTDLPAPDRAPTADELFNDVLGLNDVDETIHRGSFIPQITALPGASSFTRPPPSKQADIIDILAGVPSRPKVSRIAPTGIVVGSEGTTVFSVTAIRGEEKRARIFLERVKTILQVDPGRLVL